MKIENSITVQYKCRTAVHIICKICNKQLSIMGMQSHLSKSHKLLVQDYVKKFGQYRPKKLLQINRKQQSTVICLMCNQKMMSNKHLYHHISKVHHVTPEFYINKYIFNGQKQLCQCGCGKQVKLKHNYPYRVKYVSGHNPQKKNVYSEQSKRKMSISAISRIGRTNKSNTKPQRQFKLFLQKNNINYLHQYVTEYGAIDFYLPDQDLFIQFLKLLNS